MKFSGNMLMSHIVSHEHIIDTQYKVHIKQEAFPPKTFAYTQYICM